MRRYLKFSVRALLILVAAACVWLGVWTTRAKRQREAIVALEKAGAYISFGYGSYESRAGKKLRRLFGDDLFFSPTEANLFKLPINDATVAHLQRLGRLEGLDLSYTATNDSVLAPCHTSRSLSV